MEKKFKTTLTATLSLMLACAGSPPKMEKPVLVWNGSHENAGICIEKTPLSMVVSARSDEYFDIPGLSKPQTCLKASDKEFSKYGAILFEDVGTIQRYIARLKASCIEWE